jgi:hypothetical protein
VSPALLQAALARSSRAVGSKARSSLAPNASPRPPRPCPRRWASRWARRVSESGIRRRPERLFGSIGPATRSQERLTWIRRASRSRSLYVRYADDVQDYVESIVRDRHEAEDITQNVFAKLITAIAGYERQGPFAAWLLRVARDAALEQ